MLIHQSILLATAPMGDIVKAMDANVMYQVSVIMQNMPAFEYKKMSNVVVMSSDIIPVDTYNYVLATTSDEQHIQQTINDTIIFFKHKKVPFAWWVGPLDTPYNLAEYLQQAGFAKNEEYCGMYLNINAYEVSQNNQQLVIKRILTVDQMTDFVRTQFFDNKERTMWSKLPYNLPPNLYQEGASIEFYVGYIDKKPVTTAMIVFHAGVAGIYCLKTIEQERRKGYATAMVYMAIQRAKKLGYEIAILQASSQGKSLYQRLGFKECCVYIEYKLPA